MVSLNPEEFARKMGYPVIPPKNTDESELETPWSQVSKWLQEQGRLYIDENGNEVLTGLYNPTEMEESYDDHETCLYCGKLEYLLHENIACIECGESLPD